MQLLYLCCQYAAVYVRLESQSAIHVDILFVVCKLQLNLSKARLAAACGKRLAPSTRYRAGHVRIVTSELCSLCKAEPNMCNRKLLAF